VPAHESAHQRWAALLVRPLTASAATPFNGPVGVPRPSVVATAVATRSQTLPPGTVRQVLRQIRQILVAAVGDGSVASDAAKAVKAPARPRADGPILSSAAGRPLTKSIAGHLVDDIERAVGFTV
jgi:hypothetical protein